ncbi:zwei Ig domain protein zig-8-like [Euwallacea similis]|uniref:zwei Ig domain protein zig-8-like n=1 Tax=Euwallacea similis TaxID=1736056 RepID=UPI00344D9FD6
MSISSANANIALSVYNIQINLLAMSLVMIPEASTLKRYFPDEPDGADPNKNKPAHHIKKIPKVTRVPKHQVPKENNTVVVGMVGTKVVLNCNVGLSNVTVLWVKHNKIENTTSYTVLTQNNNTLVDDKRFLAMNENSTMVWCLHIRYAKPSDAGMYECQVCNRPTSSIYVRLELFEVHAVILGPSRREVDKGFPIRLSCVLNSTSHHRIKKRPTYMFWYHDNRMINYDLKDGAVVREGRLGTELIFQRARPEHTGNYSCVPSNARQASVQVTVRYTRNEQLTSSALTSSSNLPVASKFDSFLTLLLLAVAVCVYR